MRCRCGTCPMPVKFAPTGARLQTVPKDVSRRLLNFVTTRRSATTIVLMMTRMIAVKLLGSNPVARPNLILCKTMCVIPNLGRTLM